MIERCFTPASARRTLRRIRPTAEKLYRLFHELEHRRPAVVGSDVRVEPLYFTMLAKLVRGLDELRDAGVLVEDLGLGVLDFPAQRDGLPVLLCWRVGEPSLEFWHDPGDACNRRRVDDEGPWGR